MKSPKRPVEKYKVAVDRTDNLGQIMDATYNTYEDAFQSAKKYAEYYKRASHVYRMVPVASIMIPPTPEPEVIKWSE